MDVFIKIPPHLSISTIDLDSFNEGKNDEKNLLEKILISTHVFVKREIQRRDITDTVGLFVVSPRECQNAVLIKLSGSIGAALLRSQNFVLALLRRYQQDR